MTTYCGRFRYAFNITLLIGGTFGIAAGGANNFVTLASLVAVIGMGVGGRPGLLFLRKSELDIYYTGNVPVDSVVLLGYARHFLNDLFLSLISAPADFLPGSHQYLLTSVFAFWGIGFIVANGVRVVTDALSHCL